MLICVGGRGYYQEWGQPAQEMLPGDVVNIPTGVKHWHGAAPIAGSRTWRSPYQARIARMNGSSRLRRGVWQTEVARTLCGPRSTVNDAFANDRTHERFARIRWLNRRARQAFYALRQEAPNKNLKKGHGWKAH